MSFSCSGTVAPAIPNDGELAWHLANEITQYMSRSDRISVYVKLGCGDNFDAIVQILTLVQRR